MNIYNFFVDLFISLGSTSWLYEPIALGFSVLSLLSLVGLSAYLAFAVTKWVFS